MSLDVLQWLIKEIESKEGGKIEEKQDIAAMIVLK